MKQDKLLHFLVCAGIAFLTAMVAYLTGGSQLNRVLVGIFTALLCGVVKEYADKAHGGDFDWGDLVADFAGGVIGALLFLGCTYDTIL